MELSEDKLTKDLQDKIDEKRKALPEDKQLEPLAKNPFLNKIANYQPKEFESEEEEKPVVKKVVVNLPPRFKNETFETYKTGSKLQEEKKEQIKEYIKDCKGTGMMFLGKTGTGKTHLASACINYLAEQGKSNNYATVFDVLDDIKNNWNSATVLKYTNPYILVLDEVGLQYDTPTETLYLNKIINDRYNHFKPTILISNLDSVEFKEILGERIIDRFREGGKLLICDWESYRK